MSPTACGGCASRSRIHAVRARRPSGRCEVRAGGDAGLDVVDEAQARARGARVTSGSAIAEAAVAHAPARSSLSKSAKPSRTASIASKRSARAALGLVHRLAQPGVRAVEQVERLLEIARAAAHLLLQRIGALEMGIGRAALVGRLLDARHQHRGRSCGASRSAARACRRDRRATSVTGSASAPRPDRSRRR